MNILAEPQAHSTMQPALNRMTARELKAATAAGATCEEIVRACLARIDARENDVRAWACLDCEAALRQARALDRMGPRDRPLFGIPIGVKDIIDTADLPTQMGFHSTTAIGQGRMRRASRALARPARLFSAKR
jgi:Asp-tRNA(Asn)/Glu-tRNA(Gln) amidotransferase A subunit family amidase